MADGDTPAETSEQKAERLERELASRDAELRGYKATLDALKTREPEPGRTDDAPVATDPVTGLNPQLVNALRSRGYKDEDIAFNMRLLNDFLPAVAQPMVAALAAIGDQADLAGFLAEERADEATLTVKEEVEKLRRADLSAGRPVRSRKDYGIVVKARRTAAANSPDAIEKLVQERVQEELRKASGASATQRGAGVSSQNAGPGPAGGVVTGKGRTISRDEFERLPLKEKLEILGDAAA